MDIIIILIMALCVVSEMVPAMYMFTSLAGPWGVITANSLGKNVLQAQIRLLDKGCAQVFILWGLWLTIGPLVLILLRPMSADQMIFPLVVTFGIYKFVVPTGLITPSQRKSSGNDSISSNAIEGIKGYVSESSAAKILASGWPIGLIRGCLIFGLVLHMSLHFIQSRIPFPFLDLLFLVPALYYNSNRFMRLRTAAEELLLKSGSYPDST